MNRRKFFGMTAAAIAAAGLPALVLPEKKIFLPPRLGWPLRMREVEQYLINNDSLAMRWDMAWITSGGEYEQHYILEEPITGTQFTSIDPEELTKIRELMREDARVLLSAKVPAGAKMVQLKLPPVQIRAAYV